MAAHDPWLTPARARRGRRHRCPPSRLTPQPSDSAPAWLVTASSQTHTSAAPIASPTRAASASSLRRVDGRRRHPEDRPVDRRASERRPARLDRRRDPVVARGVAADALDLDLLRRGSRTGRGSPTGRRPRRGAAASSSLRCRRRGLRGHGDLLRRHPARRWAAAPNAAPVMSAVSWYLSPRYTQLAAMITRPRTSASTICSRRHACPGAIVSRRRVSASGTIGLDGHAGRAGHDPVAAGEELVQRPLEVLGAQARDERRGHPGRLDRHRVAVAEPEPREPDGRVADGDPQPAGDGRVGGHELELQDAAAGDDAARGHVLREAREPEDAGERPRHDVRAGAVAPLDEALGDERVGRGPDRHPGDAPARAEVTLARQPVADARRRDELAEPRPGRVSRGILALDHRGSLRQRSA